MPEGANQSVRKRTVHLERMLTMKEQRLSNYIGTEQGQSFLKADIHALRFALEVIEAAYADDLNFIARRG